MSHSYSIGGVCQDTTRDDTHSPSQVTASLKRKPPSTVYVHSDTDAHSLKYRALCSLVGPLQVCGFDLVGGKVLGCLISSL